MPCGRAETSGVITLTALLSAASNAKTIAPTRGGSP
jgi:hypothetical protein